LGSLQSRQPQQRALAVRRLGELGRREDVVLLRQAAKDGSALVRAEAVTALAKSADPPQVSDLLAELLGDPEEGVRSRAAASLGSIRTDKSRAYLTASFSQAGRSTREAIVRALQDWGLPHAFESAVSAEAGELWERHQRALARGSVAERAAAAEELGRSGRSEAVTRLTALGAEGLPILSAAAVRGLGHAMDPQSAPAIADWLEDGPPERQEAACEALGKLGQPRWTGRLLTLALEEDTRVPATAALLALPRGPATDRALCELALSGAGQNAIAAGRAMRLRGGCPVQPLIKKLGQALGVKPRIPRGRKKTDPDEAVSALQGIAALGRTAELALPLVTQALNQPERRLQQAALEALAEIGDDSAAAAVRVAYQKELQRVEERRADWIPGPLPKVYAPGFEPPAPGAAQNSTSQAATGEGAAELARRVHELNQSRLKAAGKATAAEPPSEVIDDLPDEQLGMLAAAIRALASTGADAALPMLKSHLADPYPTIRAAAYLGLTKLGLEGLAAAEPGLSDSDPRARAEAAQAMARKGPDGQRMILQRLERGGGLTLLTALEGATVKDVPIQPLLDRLEKGGPEGLLAARLLGNLRAKTAVAALVKSLDSEETVARREILIALGKIGERGSADALAKYAYDESPEVRAAAAAALGRLGDQTHLELLNGLQSDFYRQVRESARGAVSEIRSASLEVRPP
jgi:HEAT repeat protein